MITVTPSQAKKALTKILAAKKFAMLSGSPGIGKSWIAQQIADEFRLKLIDTRLAQSDPTDLNGFPGLSSNQTRMEYKPPEDFPLEGIDSVPTGYKGWLILFDELNSAPISVQAAAYKVILDRKIGKYNIHSKAFMMGAGNLQTDRAIVNKLSTAMQSRMIHLHLEVSNLDWQEWAAEFKVDYRVRSFIRFRPELLHKFDPNHDDVTYPCPRTWHFLSDIIKPTKDFDTEDLAIIQGTVGEGAGIEFNAYSRVCADLPSLEQMENDPESIIIPDEPSHQYAYSTLLGASTTLANCDQLMVIVEKLPLEFQVVTLKDIYARKDDTRTHPLIQAWKDRNAKKFFDR